MSRAPFRLLLVTLLASGVGLATEAAAFAAPGQHAGAAAGGDKQEPKKKKRKKPTVKLGASSFGKILVDAKGNTLYAFDPDGTDTSASKCSGGCEQIWPKATATKVVAGKGLDKELLTLNDSDQLAYNDHLLYTFSGDQAKGDTNGQGVGGIWHVVNADGDTVTS